MILRKTHGPAQVYKSLLRFCSDLCATSPHPVLYHAWDSRNEESELPRADLLGLSGWSYRDDGDLLYVSCGLSLSTIEDANLMREIEILDYIHEHAGRGNTVPIRDPNTGFEVNSLGVTAFEILPPGATLIRNYRTAALEMLLNRAASD